MLRVTDDGPRLVGGYSASSGLHHFPLNEVCPYTGAGDVVEVALPTTGRVWLWTSVNTAPPGYHGPVPYGFGVVELDDIGLRLVTRLAEPDPTRLREGQRVELVVESLPGGADAPPLDMWSFAVVTGPDGAAS